MKKILVILTVVMAMATWSLSAQTNEVSKKAAKLWTESGVWAQGWEINPHISADLVEFAVQYQANKETWTKLFKFLANNDLSKLAVGKHVIDGDKCWITVSEYTPKSADNTVIESHKKYVDLQYTLSGDEMMGIGHNAVEKEPYNAAKDVTTYSSGKMKFYPTSPEYFFLFFPADIHQPSVAGKTSVPSKKIVAKIIYSEVK